MSLEAVPIVFKNRDENGGEIPMFGLLIRPQGGQGNAATTVFPIAPVNGNGQSTSQIQLQQSGNGTTILRTNGPNCPPALLAAAQSAVAHGIPSNLRPLNKSGSGHPSVLTLPPNVRVLSPPADVKAVLSATNKAGINGGTKEAKPRNRKPTKKSGASKSTGTSNGSASEAETFAKPRTPPSSSNLLQTTSKSSTSAMMPSSVYAQHPPPVFSHTHGSELEDLNGIELNQLPTINTEDYQQYLDPPQLHSAANSHFAYPAAPQRPSTSSFYAPPTPHIQSPPVIPQQSLPSTSASSSFHYPQSQHHPPHYPLHNVHHVQQQQQQMQLQWRAAHPNAPTPGSNQLSTSPDSGIQSIDGSPPCTIAFTPPIVSPYTTQNANYGHADHQQSTSSVQPSAAPPSNHDEEEEYLDDYSDMPTLVPADQMDASADTPESMEQPVLVRDDSKSDLTEGSRATSRADEDKIDLQNMDIAEIVDRLKSVYDAEKLKQFTSLIQSKSVESAAAANPESSSAKKTPAGHSSSVDPSAALASPSTISPRKSPPIKRQRKTRALRASSADELVQEVPSSQRRTTRAGGANRKPRGAQKRRNADVTPPPSEQTNSGDEDEENEEEEETEEDRRRKYRECVQRALKNRLQMVTDAVAEEFGNVRLSLGPRFKCGLVWKSPNWRAIEARARKRRATADPNDLLSLLIKHEEEPNGFEKEEAEEPPTKRRRGRPMPTQSAARESESRKPPPKSRAKAKKPTARKSKAAAAPEPDFVYQAASRSTSPNSLKLTIVRKSSAELRQSPLVVRPPPALAPPLTPKRRRSKNTPRDEFVKIRSNDLVESPVRLPEPKKCRCEPKDACADLKCTNRKDNVECTQSSCKLHGGCSNRRMTNNEAVHQLQMFDTEQRGRAIRTTTDIAEGQFICEFVGEVVKTSTYQHRTLLRDESMPRFGIHLASGFVVDATQRGNIARFINHSCEPNCEMQRWLCSGHYRLGIFARRCIKEGEELTYDYGRFVRLEPEQECRCGSAECRGLIAAQPVANPVLRPESLDDEQIELIRDRNVLLVRNLTKFGRASVSRAVAPNRKYPELSEFLLSFYQDIAQVAETKQRIPRQRITQLKLIMRRLMQIKHTTPEELTARFDGALKGWITSLIPSYDRRGVDSLKSHFVHLKKTRPPPNIEKEAARAFCEDRKRPSITNRRDHRILSVNTDLTYMDGGVPIGSYDLDLQITPADSNTDADCVRCVCGIAEDEGEMVQCDGCKYWMHADCIGFDESAGDEYKCVFCSEQLTRTPNVDVVLKPQPKVAFQNCTYFRTLTNKRGIQVRINESVYVERLINDDYKTMLKEMHEECTQPKKKGARPKAKKSTSSNDARTYAQMEAKFSRRDVRHFRVERLFISPDGERFVFGCYYARPHETFCDSSRLFHKNEVFWTPFFDTLPLDAVVGRCLVLDPETWTEGRPKNPHYEEDDVFICEFQIDRNQRSFAKIPMGNHYYLNKAPYVFQTFPDRKQLKRSFTPFVLEGESGKAERCELKERINAVNKEICMKRLANIWTMIAKKKKVKLERMGE